MPWTEPIKNGFRARYRDASGVTKTAGWALTEEEAFALAVAAHQREPAPPQRAPRRHKWTIKEASTGPTAQAGTISLDPEIAGLVVKRLNSKGVPADCLRCGGKMLVDHSLHLPSSAPSNTREARVYTFCKVCGWVCEHVFRVLARS